MNTSACTLCAVPTDGESQSIEVCHPCHDSLVASGHVRETGVFDRETLMREDSDTHTRVRRQTGVDLLGCAWCGKDGDSVQRMFSQGEVSICSECIDFCVRVMASD